MRSHGEVQNKPCNPILSRLNPMFQVL